MNKKNDIDAKPQVEYTKSTPHVVFECVAAVAKELENFKIFERKTIFLVLFLLFCFLNSVSVQLL